MNILFTWVQLHFITTSYLILSHPGGITTIFPSLGGISCLGGISWPRWHWGDRTPWGHFNLSWGHKKPRARWGFRDLIFTKSPWTFLGPIWAPHRTYQFLICFHIVRLFPYILTFLVSNSDQTTRLNNSTITIHTTNFKCLIKVTGKVQRATKS